MNFETYADSEMMMISLAGQVASQLENILISQDSAVLVVSGGSTPGPMFDILSDVSLDWARIGVMLSDERWIPMDSPRSNTKLIKQRLLAGRAAAAQYIPMFLDGHDFQSGAAALAQKIETHLPISVAVLGMGADMHTASLFPKSNELPAAQAVDAPAVIGVIPNDAGLEPRITLSARALKSAFYTHVLIKGDDKKAALAQAQTLPADQAPIADFLPSATVHWAQE